MILIISGIFFIFSVFPLEAGTIYKLNYDDIAITAGGIALAGGGAYLEGRMVPPDTADIANLPAKKEDINTFDRFATDLWSEEAQKLSDVLLYSSFLFPFSVFGSEKGRSHFWEVLGLYFEAFFLSFGINKITKVVVHRYRPYMYNDNREIPVSLKQSVDSKESFYSGHTTIAFTFSVLTAKLWSDLSIAPGSRNYVWGGAILLGSMVGMLRVVGGKHFPTDVVTGAVIGGVIGFFVPELHKVQMKQNGGADIAIGASRIEFRYRF